MGWIIGLVTRLLGYVVGWRLHGRVLYPAEDMAREAERIWSDADLAIKTGDKAAPEVDFVSTAVPVEGAANYNEMKWDTFTSVTETPGQFAFYSGKSVALVIRKSRFKDRLELLTLRRVIRRHVANNELLDD